MSVVKRLKLPWCGRVYQHDILSFREQLKVGEEEEGKENIGITASRSSQGCSISTLMC